MVEQCKECLKVKKFGEWTDFGLPDLDYTGTGGGVRMSYCPECSVVFRDQGMFALASREHRGRGSLSRWARRTVGATLSI